MTSIAALAVTSGVVAALARAAKPVGRVELFHNADPWLHRVSRNEDALFVVEVGMRTPYLAHAVVRTCVQRTRQPVIGIMEPVCGNTRLLSQVIRAGMQDIALLGIDSVQLVMEHWAQTNWGGVEERILGILFAVARSDSDRAFLESLAPFSLSHHGLSSIAAQLGVSPRTLARRCQASGYEAPGHLLRRIRAIAAILLIVEYGRSVESAAKSVGVGTAKSLSRLLRGLTGFCPTGLRQRALAEAAIVELSRSFAVAPDGVREDARNALSHHIPGETPRACATPSALVLRLRSS